MALTWVKIDGPLGNDVYVNGNFQEAGGTTDAPFQVETPRNRFTLLDEARNIIADREVDVPLRHTPETAFSIALWPAGTEPGETPSPEGPQT